MRWIFPLLAFAGCASSTMAGSSEDGGAGQDPTPVVRHPDDAAPSSTDAGASDAPSPPDASAPDLFPRLVVRSEGLAKIRAALATSPTKEDFDLMRGDADAALARSSNAVADLNVPGYYFDADGHRAAKQRLIDDGGGAYALALTAALLPSNDPARAGYVAHAAMLVDAWATTNKSISGEDGPLVLAYKGIFLLLAADLLMVEPTWTAQEQQQFLSWVQNVFRASVSTIRDQPDNVGCWGRLGMLAAARMLGDKAGATTEVSGIETYLSVAVAPNGEMIEENKRHVKGMKYTFFALSPLTVAAQIARTGGFDDLFQYTTPNNRSLKLALDKYFTYAVNPSSWPYTVPTDPVQIALALASPSAMVREDPTQTDWPANLYDAVSAVYKMPDWETWAAVGNPMRGSELWVYPTLLRPALE